MPPRPCAFALVLMLIAAAPAAGQETRAELIARKQREKAASLETYQPGRFERVMDRLEQNMADPPSGFYPTTGRVYAGGGFSLGAGYRYFFGRNAVWDVSGLYSIKNYKLVELGVRKPWRMDGRANVAFRAGWLDATQVGFYGLGMDTTRGDRANFGLRQSFAAASAEVLPTRFTRLDGEIGVEAYSTGQGAGRAPSIETRYDALSAPGLASGPTYIRARGTAAIDWRRSPGYSRRGGYYGVTLFNYADRDNRYDFQRLEGELIQHLPLLRENWVISLRGRMQTTLDDADLVPYYLLPSLGGGRTLRGYPTDRFRGRHSLLTSAELRWIVNRLALDMAFFYDAGKVAADRADLDFEGMKRNWGLGARFHGPTSTVLRIEAARGEEGWRLVFATSSAF